MSWLTQAGKAVSGAVKTVGTVAQGISRVPIIGGALAPVLNPIATGARLVGGVLDKATTVGRGVAAAVQPITGRPPPPPTLTPILSIPPLLPLTSPMSLSGNDFARTFMQVVGRAPDAGEMAYGGNLAGDPMTALSGSPIQSQAGAYIVDRAKSGAGNALAFAGGVMRDIGNIALPGNPFGAGIFTGLGPGGGPSTAAPQLPAVQGQVGGLHIYNGKLYGRTARGRRIRVTFNRWGMLVPAPKRMNVLNPHALGRANRRMGGFRRVATRTLGQLGFSVKRRGGGAAAARKGGRKR